MSERETAIEVHGLVARYGERTILGGVDLTVKRGEIRVVLGGSGCGKSTLLKHCVGRLTPTAGDVRILGLPIRRPDTLHAFRMLCRHNKYVQDFGNVRDPDEIAAREAVWDQALAAIELRTGLEAPPVDTTHPSGPTG